MQPQRIGTENIYLTAMMSERDSFYHEIHYVCIFVSNCINIEIYSGGVLNFFDNSKWRYVTLRSENHFFNFKVSSNDGEFSN